MSFLHTSVLRIIFIFIPPKSTKPCALRLKNHRINKYMLSRSYRIYPMEDYTITLIIALPLPSHQRSTISGRYPTILTKYIFPCGAVRWHRWPEVATGREGGTPSCTPRGTRWAEFNLEQPYVLWCSVHGQCSRHRTNARHNDLRSPDGNHAGFVRTFSLLS